MVVSCLLVFFGFLHGGVVEFFDFKGELITSFFGVTECRGSTLFNNFGTFTAIRCIKPKKKADMSSSFFLSLLLSIVIFLFAFKLLILFCFISLQFSITGHIEYKKTLDVFLFVSSAFLQNQRETHAQMVHTEISNIIPVERSLTFRNRASYI